MLTLFANKLLLIELIELRLKCKIDASATASTSVELNNFNMSPEELAPPEDITGIDTLSETLLFNS